MRTVLAVAIVSFVSVAGPALGAEECSKWEMLKLTNQIDRMNLPDQYESKCIAQQEVMKAGHALAQGFDDLCMERLQNAEAVVNGNVPAGLEKNSGCAEY